MKKYIMITILVVSVCFASIGVNASANEKAVVIKEAEVIFEKGFYLDDLKKVEKIDNIVIKQIVTESIIDGDYFTTFHVIDGDKNIEIIIEEYTDQYEALLIDSIGHETSLEKLKLEKQLKKFNDNGKNIEVSKIFFEYSENAKKNNFKKIFKNNILEMNIQSVIEKENNDEVSKSSSLDNWVPNSGSASVFPSSVKTDATYLEVEYKYDSASDLSTLTNDEDSTLEAEIVLYNYDEKALANNWYDGYDSSWTFASNQPRAYIDTQAFDNSDEPRFTIGCASAEDLESGTDYYWRAYGNETGKNGDKVKLYFQRGHRIIDSNYSTWNIFQDETIVVIPFSDWPSGVSTKSFTYSD